MARLVNVERRFAGKLDLNNQAPALILDRAALDAAFLHIDCELSGAFAEEIQLMLRYYSVAVMDRGLGGRQAKDHVASAGINGRKSENIPKKFVISLSVIARYNDMCPDYHTNSRETSLPIGT